jgi:Tfp pilus assembly protein PilO
VKKYFSQLRPLERRLAVGVLVVLFIVLNWVFVWPHFSDWGKLRVRIDDARNRLKLYQTAIAQMPAIQSQVKIFENEGEFVAPEDQSINFLRTIQSQALQSGVGIVNTSRQMTHTNEFFSEQTQNLDVIATDSQLVDFLYKLGSGASMVRVRDLEIQPDPSHQHLSGKIRLVASYQKNATAPATAANSVVKIAPMATHIATSTNSKPQIKKITQ